MSCKINNSTFKALLSLLFNIPCALFYNTTQIGPFSELNNYIWDEKHKQQLINRIMKYNYSHTQTGKFLIAILLIPALIMAFTELIRGHFIIPLLWGTLLVAALFFAQMGVTVDNREVRVTFCFGLFVKHIDITRIRSCKVVQPKWYHGIGIHFLGKNTSLYNVSYNKAVEVTLYSGYKIQIGSNDSENLAEAINKELKK